MTSLIIQIKMTRLDTDEVFNFRVNRWMSRQEDDHDMWRELPVVVPGRKPLPGEKSAISCTHKKNN